MRNIGASVLAKLRQIARASGEDLTTVLQRYAQERLLWRLTQTRWADRIALKGAMIFVARFGDIHRPTSDIDLNGYDTGGIETLVEMVRDAVAVPGEDGVVYLGDTVEIRKDRDWSTVRGGKVSLDARIDTARVRLHVDAGFGNAVTPAANFAEYPSLIPGLPQAVVRIYPFESMVADKLHAMSRHGAETSRMRDYYDLWVLSERQRFDGDLLAAAVRAVFGQFGDPIPLDDVDGLSDDFVAMSSRQWESFRRGKGLRFSAPPLPEAVGRIRQFILPVLGAACGGPDPGVWEPGRGWAPVPALVPF